VAVFTFPGEKVDVRAKFLIATNESTLWHLRSLVNYQKTNKDKDQELDSITQGLLLVTVICVFEWQIVEKPPQFLTDTSTRSDCPEVDVMFKANQL
jgi:hypothetical protein